MAVGIRVSRSAYIIRPDLMDQLMLSTTLILGPEIAELLILLSSLGNMAAHADRPRVAGNNGQRRTRTAGSGGTRYI